MRVRAREDRAATEILAARSVHLGFLDGQYRGHDPLDEDAVVDALSTLIGHHRIAEVVGPVGLAHPDHIAAARIYAALLRARPYLEAWVYEELPYRVLGPDQVPERLAEWKAAGWAPALGFFGTGPLATKEAAIDCYQSQAWALDKHAIRCPERLHRLWRT